MAFGEMVVLILIGATCWGVGLAFFACILEHNYKVEKRSWQSHRPQTGR